MVAETRMSGFVSLRSFARWSDERMQLRVVPPVRMAPLPHTLWRRSTERGLCGCLLRAAHRDSTSLHPGWHRRNSMGLGRPGPAQASKHWSLPLALASGRVPLPGVEAAVCDPNSMW